LFKDVRDSIGYCLNLDGAALTESAASSISNGKIVFTCTGAFSSSVADSDTTIAYTPAVAGNAAKRKRYCR
jgi:hypothetical protein